jgi:hypothetical protein
MTKGTVFVPPDDDFRSFARDPPSPPPAGAASFDWQRTMRRFRRAGQCDVEREEELGGK